MKFISLAYLKNTTGIVACCKETNEIVVANRNGQPKLILMSRAIIENSLGIVMDNALINFRRDMEMIEEPVLIRTFNNPAENVNHIV